MKAKTMGQRKRGRRKVEYVAREPNGRISRSKEPASKLALEARARMLRISMEEAKDQKAGTFLGVLHMAYIRWEKSGRGRDKAQPEQSLSTGQYHALLSCKELHNDYLKAIGAPGAYYDQHLGNSGDEEAHARWCRAVKEAWEGKKGEGGVKRAIQDAQNYDRSVNLWAALDLCVIQEQYLPHMVSSLRTLGNVLSRHFQRG